MALLTAVFATALLMGMGLSIALSGMTEASLAGHDRAGRALREASLAAAHLAIVDLRAQPSWSAVLAGGGVPPLSAAPGRALDSTLTPTSPFGGPPLDLAAITADVQAAADTGSGDPQVWRLFESGRFDVLVPGASQAPWYVAAWVADDWADLDGDPSVDANGIVVVRGVAFGPAGASVTTVVSLRKTTVDGDPDRVQILAIRPPD